METRIEVMVLQTSLSPSNNFSRFHHDFVMLLLSTDHPRQSDAELHTCDSAVRNSAADDGVETMEWMPYPASFYIRDEQRRYYSASDEVQDMMWEPYPAANFSRAE